MPIVVSWLLNFVYLVLLAAVSPILVYRRVVHGKYRGGWREKLMGQLSRRAPNRRCIWFHAVSVGEVLQLQRLLLEVSSRWPDAELLITTTTDTGFEVANTKYPQHTVCYFPLDFSWAVDRALSTIQPNMVVLVELELWPNFVAAVSRRNVPLVLINGRIGEKSFRGYLRIKPLVKRIISCFDAIGVQNATYAERLVQLGADRASLTVTGNIKFDRVESDRCNPATEELREAFGLDRNQPILVAGSTQEPEENFAIQTWKTLRNEYPSLRLIVVPRHKERFEDVAKLIQQLGHSLLRRSWVATRSDMAQRSVRPISQSHQQASPSDTILLLDTLGELGACWGLADIAFVGGSLTQRGGQNMLEPAAYGAAVIFGPNTWNFRDITDSLLTCGAARVVNDANELTETVRFLLNNPSDAVSMGEAAKSFVASQQGATSRTLDVIQSGFSHAETSRKIGYAA